MKITIGEWKTRGGDKATVVAENDKAVDYSRFIGWADRIVCCWYLDGARFANATTQYDLIAPWTDPVPWDWSTTPPWLNVLHKGPYGNWRLFEDEPFIHNGNFSIPDAGIEVPSKYHPKWTGDWKLSKTMRPGYKEVK